MGIMIKIQSMISVIFAVILVLLLNLGDVAEAKSTQKPATYTSEQIAQIQEYMTDVDALRDRLPELAKLIQDQNWVFVRNFIHGPLGEMRVKLANLSRNLLPDAQKQANKLAKDVFNNLVAIDQAAANKDYKTAIRNYGETIRDLEEFLKLVPQA
jgi:photosystem II protein PsbQ